MTEKMNKRKQFKEHLDKIKNNPQAYTYVLEEKELRKNLFNKFKDHLRNGDLKDLNARSNKKKKCIEKIINLIFETQEKKPFYYDENNNPVETLENLTLHSGRCNDQLQTILTVDEVKQYGGKLEARINEVMAKRKKLFESQDRKQLKEVIENN